MDIVVICNGLGNQMSQYAFFLQKKNISKSTRFLYDRKSCIDHNGYELNKFNIDYKDTFINKVFYFIFRILGIKKLPFISRPLIKSLNLLGLSLINEKYNYDYDKNHLIPSKGLRFYYGGWHSEKYFLPVKNQVLDTFKFSIPDADENLLKMLDKIQNTNSVSIHVRRGDFVNEKNMSTFGAVCSKEYFEMAIKKICSLIKDPHFFVFSNDIPWVKEHIKHESIIIVDINKGNDSWKDIYLMSNCKHNINSNSSFSWWGAWLNANINKIVIVPKFFINNEVTKDVYPTNWLQLTDY